MRRLRILASAALLVSCGGGALALRHDGPRAALVDELCEPLPRRAYDCVVGWPASVAPDRRAAVASASDGSTWARVAGVRAFASCADRAAADGPVAHIVVLLIDGSVGSAEEIADRLPVRARWTEACEGAADECASYFARAEGDRLVLTRRVARAASTEEDVAHLACAAVRDGAEEAHARVDEEDALVRELRIEETGVALTTRRPGGRGGSERTHRTWTELQLDVLDDRIRHDAEVRAAARARPIDPEQVDVSSADTLDAQVHARRRRLARDRSPAALRDLARVAERGFGAHPSRPDLGQVAVESYVEAGDVDAARAVLASLASVVGAADAHVVRLGILTSIAARDASELAERIADAAPDLVAAEHASVAAALIEQLGARPLDTQAIAMVPPAMRAFLGAVRAAHVPWRRRGAARIAPASGAPWAIHALTSGTASGLVTVCGDRSLPTLLVQQSTSRGGALTMATLGACGAALLVDGSAFELAAGAQGLLALTGTHVSIAVEVDGHFVGLAGQLDASRALRVDAATAGLVHADLVRVAREVVAPLDAIGGRVFPAPTLHVPIAAELRARALSAASLVEGVSCRASDAGAICDLESGESVERFVDVAEAMSRAE